MSRIKTIIVDNEERINSSVTNFIKELNPAFDVCGHANKLRNAYDLIRLIQPQLVFLDLNMKDGNGFELLNLFEKIDFEIVIISAMDHHAIKAFEYNAIDYILKPIVPEQFSNRLKKIQGRIRQELVLHSIDHDAKGLTLLKMPVQNKDGITLVNVDDIIYVQADKSFTVFKTSAQKKIQSARRFSDLEFLLEKCPYLVKVNKDIYINLNHIAAYSKGNSCTLTLRDRTAIEVSRRKKKEILDLISGRKRTLIN